LIAIISKNNCFYERRGGERREKRGRDETREGKKGG
tara:strand:+ start:496 stop:603 length:108 start_codon:yes stop_codon:yes gene_type:complete